jgi:hypothetical protein
MLQAENSFRKRSLSTVLALLALAAVASLGGSLKSFGAAQTSGKDLSDQQSTRTSRTNSSVPNELIYGLRTPGTATNSPGIGLVSFNSTTPGAITNIGPFTGVVSDHLMRSIDFRPATRELYAISTNGPAAEAQIYKVNLATAAVTPVGSTFTLGNANFITRVEMEFNPVSDTIRVIVGATGDSGLTNNFRIDPNNGTLISIDTSLSYDASDPQAGEGNFSIVGAAFSNNVAGATTTTLYGWEWFNSSLVTIGGPGGNPSPNTGRMFTVNTPGLLTQEGLLGMDISGTTSTLYVTHDDPGTGTFMSFYTRDAATGAETPVGSYPSGTFIGDLSVFPGPAPAGEDVILQWNRVLTETILTPGAHPAATIFPVRSYAMMHAAMFDAVNSIDRIYTPYYTDVTTNSRASRQAAAAKAAHDVLVALYPARQAIFAAELTTSLNGVSASQAAQGFKIGGTVATRLLMLRANDGWNVTPPPYVLLTTPGNWQPTPPANSAATFTHYPAVLPFAVTSNSLFSLAPPPALTSAEYARDFNEVKEIGSATSTTRTTDQTKIAQLWANVNTPTTALLAWNNVARGLAVSRGLTTIESARLFALFNIAVHDSLLTTFTGKFQYGLWRPVTAIRRADEDGNPDTTQDAGWTSLIATPPYPSFPGNMAGVGTAHATTLGLFFGRDDIAFTHTWEGAGGATRSYPGFMAMADEEANSRIYGGIHYRFDNVAGQSAGRNVANYVFRTVMLPRQCVN